MPNVWRYRQAFETRLPAVFSHLADLHRSLIAYSGRLGAESFRAQCGFVVSIWENWIVFTPAVTDLMKAILNGADLDGKNEPGTEDRPEEGSEGQADPSRSKFKKTGGFKASFKPLTAASRPVTPVEDDDVDGEAMAEDLDGQAIDDDVDGEAMDEDADGAAMADDVDGEALDGALPPVPGTTPTTAVSLEEEDVDGDDMVIDVDSEEM